VPTIGICWTTVILAGILVAAAALRLWALGEVGLRGDEAVYTGQAAVLAGDPDASRYFVPISRGNSNFLLYQYFVSLAFAVTHVSDVTARVISALFSLGSVVVTFALARALYGRIAGILAAGYLALSAYAVLLGRLAFLDSTIVFFFVLTLFCYVQFTRGGRMVWLCGFAACAALTIEAKLTGGLALVICLVHAAMTGQLRRLSGRQWLGGVAVFLLSMTPALLQIGATLDDFTYVFSGGGRRVSRVPWFYYFEKITAHEGFVIPLIWLAGLLVAVKRRTSADRLVILWIVVTASFLQIYPLKGFNYLLPLTPAFAILAGSATYRAIVYGRSAMRRFGMRPPAAVPALTTALLLVLVGASVPLARALAVDEYAGLREAGYWLRAHSARTAGVMTVSNGSAQYAISFYGHRDAFPFGRFRLATILPGGRILASRVVGDLPPKDWVERWPPRLIELGRVSYLVYFTNESDDPPDDPLVRSAVQKQFRDLIQDYGGRLVYTYYRHHEGRVWVYKITRRLPKARIGVSVRQRSLLVAGRGFTIESRVKIYYHNLRIGTARTNRAGAFSTAVSLPRDVSASPSYFLVAADQSGIYASLTGLREARASGVHEQ
jgi:dolichyl-phosphate-mannose-protein mannosyltransferase